MLNRSLFALALVSALSPQAFSAEGKYDFSHYACGPQINHFFDDRGILKMTGGELRPANDTLEDIFLVDNFRRGDLVDSPMALESASVNSDGSLTITGAVDIAPVNKKGGGFVGRTMVTFIPHGDLYGKSQTYEATKKSTGEVIEYALGAPGDTGMAGWSVYQASFFIAPMLPVFNADFRIAESTVSINLNNSNEKAVKILCGDNATAYAVFTK